MTNNSVVSKSSLPNRTTKRQADTPKKHAPAAKLDATAVLDCYSGELSQKQYAAKYGVSEQTVRLIQWRKTWREITADAPEPRRDVRSRAARADKAEMHRRAQAELEAALAKLAALDADLGETVLQVNELVPGGIR